MPEPNRPSITPAQIVAVLIAGVPAVAKLLAAFAVYTVTSAQQDALSGALTWLGVVAGVLIGADAALRSARNSAHARTATAPAPLPSGATGQWTSLPAPTQAPPPPPRPIAGMENIAQPPPPASKPRSHRRKDT